MPDYKRVSPTELVLLDRKVSKGDHSLSVDELHFTVAEAEAGIHDLTFKAAAEHCLVKLASRVRAMFEAGDMDGAKAILGRTYDIAKLVADKAAPDSEARLRTMVANKAAEAGLTPDEYIARLMG